MFNTADMFRVFQPLRGDAVVIPGRGGRHWINISTNEKRDIPLGDPAMGGHASFALGMALAQPDEKVVLFDSEGDILMNLGALVTIAEKAPQNLYHFVLDNEVYATTGGQLNQDTAATYTERFLNAFGIQYYLVENDSDAERISVAFEEAERTKRPVAILVGDEFHGFNR